MPLIIPPSSEAGELQFHWIDPTSTTRNLTRSSSPNLFVPVGSVNLGHVEFEISDSKFPLGPGTFIQHINTLQREFTVPIVVHEENIGDLLSAVEDLYGWFATGDEQGGTPGIFRVTRPDGTVRQIQAYYLRGLGGDTSDGGPGWVQYEVELYAPLPYPTATADQFVSKSAAAAVSYGVMNPGTLPAYPRWLISGTISGDFTIYNATTDKTIEGNIALTLGQTINIDTRPSEERTGFTVYDGTGANRISVMDPLSNFFTLAPGLNIIEVTLSGTDPVHTLVQLTYLPRYRSLLR